MFWNALPFSLVGSQPLFQRNVFFLAFRVEVTLDVLIVPSYPRRQKTMNSVVTMRIVGAVKNDMGFCQRLFQVMNSSILTLLPYPRDIIGVLPERKSERLLWNDWILRVLQGNDHSSMGGS